MGKGKQEVIIVRLIDANEFKRRIERYDPSIRDVVLKELRLTKTVKTTLPTAQPKQKTGKWIKIDKYDKGSNVQCSACLEDFDYIDGVCYLCHGYELPPFCPNCGAEMSAKDTNVLSKDER